MRSIAAASAALFWLVCSVPRAGGHDLAETTAAAVLRPDGTFVVEVTADLDALLLGAGPGHDSAALRASIAALPAAELDDQVAKLRSLFARRIRVRFDGAAVPFDVSFPDRRTNPGSPADGAEAPSFLGVRARLAGRMPEEWRELTFWASRAFEEIRLTVLELGAGRSARHELQAGEESPPFPRGPAPGSG